MTLSVEDKTKCGPCGEQVCGLDQLSQDICTFADGTYVEGAITIWDGAIYKSLVNQACVPADEDQSMTWVDVKSPDSEKQWERLGTIEDLLRLMGQGCPLTVASAVACMPISAGEWRCYDGCYRQAKVDLVLVENDDGSLNMPAKGESETAQWSKCWTTEDVLNLLNNPKGIASIDDSDPSFTTITLNDGTVFNSPEQPDTNTDTRLRNPVLNAAGTTWVWEIVDQDGQVIGTVEQDVASTYTFNDTQFDVGAGGLVSIKPCHDAPLITDECGLLYKTREIDCGDGQFKTVRVTDAARCIASTQYDGDPKVFPVDTTDHSSFIAYDELREVDFAALDADDQARLDEGYINSVTFDVTCPGVYTVGIEGVAIEYNFTTGGESTVLPILDGAYLNGGTTSPIATQSFTQQETSFSEVEFNVGLTAGQHTMDFYIIGFSKDVNAARVALVPNTARFKICKADA